MVPHVPSMYGLNSWHANTTANASVSLLCLPEAQLFCAPKGLQSDVDLLHELRKPAKCDDWNWGQVFAGGMASLVLLGLVLLFWVLTPILLAKWRKTRGRRVGRPDGQEFPPIYPPASTISVVTGSIPEEPAVEPVEGTQQLNVDETAEVSTTWGEN
ncbi:unnamed protein product [Bursaphelenchus xylophilus]|uniref:(pine wood nematode) hypothetical protein n=1 Tax=Bursaphelenchus xylophilus TaxID=6326 RepID=A0A7I8XK19_BURXY|nr:unnamed protein product [Bursaphelenchus xylophilus]CAG9118304.1 unnamed protein product [Bursaphelenchus xylophilus]